MVGPGLRVTLFFGLKLNLLRCLSAWQNRVIRNDRFRSGRGPVCSKPWLLILVLTFRCLRWRKPILIFVIRRVVSLTQTLLQSRQTLIQSSLLRVNGLCRTQSH